MIHSQEEEQNDNFFILDTIVNRFPTQIILTKAKITEIEVLNGKRRIFISQEDIQNNFMTDIFADF